jgi:hypothetical protein
MGLDAYVSCNCFKTGKSTSPPFPHLVRVGDHGGPELALPEPQTEAEETEYNETFDRFSEWETDCCEHPGCAYADAQVSNWGGYRVFQQALAHTGWEHFPVLAEWLPEQNGGMLPASEAEAALQEIHFFTEQVDFGYNTFLLNSDTNEVIQEYIEAYRGVFLQVGEEEAGVDDQGFFIQALTSTEDRTCELFRSERFSQTLLDIHQTGNTDGGKVQLRDLASGETYVGSVSIGMRRVPWPDGRMENDAGEVRLDYPRAMHTERRPLNGNYFAYITRPLEELFAASITTGNPVVWC